ncbi:hypothetical protein Pla123a_23880 [Posidoniimonas polymericola]|uniref:VWFA domain-containing protein n=1 Tax=Posidoniimonas polymericola TaxID=2528002 RepID=A0A5C5YQ14_9BACT|nr:BatA and WFA domain-containing protein [Posidoniimonas polymericola]TWT76963.1 hypothetical protein Pla123a_23880 [Posidoniimonas polymericola]
MLDGLFRNTLSPLQWSLMLAIPPAILALYFLKLKRMPIEVPSTYLWRKSIEDLRVNSFWQRLRQSILLLLQLLLVALAIFALLRPGWEGTELGGERIIFLVDNSASMGTEDVADAKDRLASAKKKVAGLIDQLDSSMSAMIIAFADTPHVVQQFTGSQGVLRERLESIELTSQPTNLLEALKLAGGLANPGQMTLQDSGVEVEVIEPVTTSLYIFSDGRFEDVEGFDLGGLDPSYVPLGSTDTANLAVTAFSTRRNEVRPEEREAFVQVTNFTEADQDVVVEVQLDGQFLDAKQASLEAGKSASLSFPLADAPPGRLTATIDAESLTAASDRLKIDNEAYAGLNRQEQGKVLLVTQGNKVLEAALSTERAGRIADLTVITPAGLDTEEYKRDAQSGEYALIIYDVCAPAEMPRSHTLFIGSRPPLAGWQGKPEVDAERFPQVIDWNRAHPLLAYVELSDLWIYESQLVDPPQGGTALIDSSNGPLMAIAPRDSYEDVVLGFPIIVYRDGSAMGNTRWFRRRSFPTFWLNTLSYLVGQLAGDAANQAEPGEPIEFRPVTNVPEVVVRSPSGAKTTLTRSGDTTFQFQDTAEPGVYEVLERGQVSKRFAVNLFDRQESDVRLRASQQEAGPGIDSIRIGYTDVTAEAGGAPARKELWQLLLALALVVLMAEWYVCNRRVYI